MAEPGDAFESVPSGSPSTTQCVDCGGLLSTRAITCPHCGAPTRTPAGMYADPQNASQLRYWNGSEWGAPAKPSERWESRCVIAFVMALVYLPVSILVGLFARFDLAPIALAYWVTTLVLGVLGMRAATVNGLRGRGLAMAGMSITCVFLLLWAVAWLAGIRTPLT